MTDKEQALRNIYEIWAGSEGIPKPETVVEAYLMRLIEQMRDEARKGIASYEAHKQSADKEQALVAAAYRLAADLCKTNNVGWGRDGQSLVPSGAYGALTHSGHCYSKAIAELTPTDAENHLRALMMKVAWAVLGKCILEGTENFQGAEKIVDGVLHDSR